MRRTFGLLFMVFVMGSSLASVTWAGTLGGARSSAHGSSRSRSSGGSSGGSSTHAGHAYGYSPGYGYGYGSWWALRAFGAPWWVPYAATGDQFERPYAFPGAPYEDGIDGYVRIAGVTPGLADSDAASHPGQRLLGRGAALRLATEGSALSPDLTRLGFSALISTSARVEIGTEWSLYTEQLHTGDTTLQQSGGVDQLWLGTVDASFLFAQGPHAQFRTGFGMRTLIDQVQGNEYGINILYGMDFYPVRPLILSIRGDAGTVGHSVVTRARATAGIIVSRVEIFGGWDQTWLFGDDDVTTRLGGPTAGLRLWL